VTYHEGFTGRSGIDLAFARAGLNPDIVMSALDADVIKTYVELGLGVGIMASVAFNPGRDTQLQMVNAQHLFPENVTNIAVRKGHYLRGYAYRFIELCSPGLDEQAVRNATNPARENDEL
jgi:LysR family transcriptional regulator, cys regulon transcriptional activator